MEIFSPSRILAAECLDFIVAVKSIILYELSWSIGSKVVIAKAFAVQRSKLLATSALFSVGSAILLRSRIQIRPNLPRRSDLGRIEVGSVAYTRKVFAKARRCIA